MFYLLLCFKLCFMRWKVVYVPPSFITLFSNFPNAFIALVVNLVWKHYWNCRLYVWECERVLWDIFLLWTGCSAYWFACNSSERDVKHVSGRILSTRSYNLFLDFFLSLFCTLTFTLDNTNSSWNHFLFKISSFFKTIPS